MGIIIPIALVVALLVGVFVVISAAKSAKGSVQLQLDKSSYSTGEIIHGTALIESKQALECRRCHATLVGTLIEERPEAEKLKDRRDSSNVFTEEINIDLPQPLAAGVKQQVEFQLAVPDGHRLPREGRESEWDRDKEGDMGWQTVKRKLRWQVAIRLDLPGLDLSDAKSVRINLR